MTSLVNVDELERQIGAQERQVGELTSQLDAARKRLSNLQVIRASYLSLDADPEDDDVFDFSDLSVYSPSGRMVIESKGPKKIRSTRMVADMLIDSGHRWVREEILDGFQNRYGFPESWQHPVNAINNAIARAVEQGWIVEQDGYYMAPALAEPRSG